MINKKYQTQSTNIQSYNYTDIAEGTGVVVFYAADLSGSTILTQNVLYSRLGHTHMTANDTATLNFDATFNTPKVIRGNLRVNLPVGVYVSAGSPTGALPLSGSVAIYHYDGTDETLLGSANEISTMAFAADDTSLYKIYAFGIDISQKEFKSGETLRVKSTFNSPLGTPTLACFMAHDPKNRLTLGSEYTTNPMAWETTQQTIHVPFVLDL